MANDGKVILGSEWWWNFFEGDTVGGFYKALKIDSTKVDIILELPPGKEAFGVYGQVNNPNNGGKSKSGGVIQAVKSPDKYVGSVEKFGWRRD